MKKPFYKRWWFWLIVVVVVLTIAGGSGGGDENTVDSNPGTVSSQTDGSVAQSTQPDAQDVSEPPVDDGVPQEYKNALAKAESYSSLMNMSKQAIYDQITSEHGEGFPAEAAQYAVDNLQADYNANALEKAKSYYYDMSMSKDAVWDQLTSEYGEQFTASEADYAIANLE